jgi:hypothetical protein
MLSFCFFSFLSSPLLFLWFIVLFSFSFVSFVLFGYLFLYLFFYFLYFCTRIFSRKMVFYTCKIHCHRHTPNSVHSFFIPSFSSLLLPFFLSLFVWFFFFYLHFSFISFIFFFYFVLVIFHVLYLFAIYKQTFAARSLIQFKISKLAPRNTQIDEKVFFYIFEAFLII